jgi:hypothetical protein
MARVTRPGAKVLCLCTHGNSRSVCLAFLLKGLGVDALAAGVGLAGADTLKTLVDWAETVILASGPDAPALLAKAPAAGGKLVVWDVGPDIYFRGFDERLLNQYRERIKQDQNP